MNVTESQKYNGWTNYPTWAVSLWIDNCEGDYRYWREEAAALLTADPDNAQDLLSRRLEKFYVDAYTEFCPVGMFSDLLGFVIREVNWQEIAIHLLDL